MVGISYTRKELRTRIERDIRDSTTIQTEADINRIISDIHKDMVERSECKRNTVIMSIADSTSDGVLEFDLNSDNRRTGTTPTLTRVDYEGYNFYTILNCDKVVKIERWVTTDDGTWTQLSPVDQEDIARLHLLNGDYTYPYYYEMARRSDTFRMLQNPSSSAYTIKLRIKYIESVYDLITDDTKPTDTTAPTFSGSGLDDMTISTASTTTYGTYVVSVGVTGGTDKYTYTKDGGAASTAADMAATVTLGTGGPIVAFAATTGHTTADTWTFYQDDHWTGDVPKEYRMGLLDGALSRVFMLRGDARAGPYGQSYERHVQRCTDDSPIDTKDAPTNIKADYWPGR